MHTPFVFYDSSAASSPSILLDSWTDLRVRVDKLLACAVCLVWVEIGKVVDIITAHALMPSGIVAETIMLPTFMTDDSRVNIAIIIAFAVLAALIVAPAEIR